MGSSGSPYRIGLIGCGTVGTGVLDLLRSRGPDLERVTGRPIRVMRIAVRDPDRPRKHLADYVDSSVELTGDALGLARSDDVDLVVEVAGGTDGPRDWIIAALASGHDVVTANKAALAFHGREIFRAAREHRRSIGYEASVAGAIPVIEVLQNALVGNRVTRILGILNGTCNYILSRMESAHIEYEDALREAQAKGFAEADPSLDVGGDDTTHKLALIAGLVTHSFIDADSIPTEGITSITRADIEFVESLGYAVKMLAIVRCTEESAWDLRAHPALIPRGEVLAQVRDEFNAVQLRGSATGQMLLYGKGAGSHPTASSVVADIVRAVRGNGPQLNFQGLEPPVRVDIGDVELRNYIRMTVLDVPGILGRITSFLGMRGISIASIHQPEAKKGLPVPVIVVTHKTKDRVIGTALEELARAKLLSAPATRIRIEE